MSVNNLYNTIIKALNPDENVWLKNAIDKLQHSADPLNELLNLSVVVKRQISSDIQSPSDLLTHCDNSEIIRIFLLQSLFEYHSDLKKRTTLKQYYQAGDSAEKSAFLKGLPLIDSNGEAKNIAVNAARCNSLDEFSALTLNNPYPAEHFEELNFNQLILKALFNGLEINDVANFEQRKNANLTNMCFSYAVEQALADRIPPASLWTAINYEQLDDENTSLYEEYIKHFYHADNHHQRVLSALMLEKKLQKVSL